MKTFVKICRIVAGETTETVETFESEIHFELASRIDETIATAKILTDSEVEEYLSPFRTAVILADRKKAEAKAILDEIKKANKALFDLTGSDYFFQDDEEVVYKTDLCEGKYVYFDPIEIKRTRREGEQKGSLSLSEARTHGFVVEGK